MRLIAKVIRISRAKFHCNKLTTVEDIQDYASLFFLRHSIYYFVVVRLRSKLCAAEDIMFLLCPVVQLAVPMSRASVGGINESDLRQLLPSTRRSYVIVRSVIL